MKTAKTMTFRQRLRDEAEKKLDTMIEEVTKVCKMVVIQHSKIDPSLVLRVSCISQSKSLRDRLIRDLANEKQDELEKIYNSQLDLAIEEATDSKDSPGKGASGK